MSMKDILSKIKKDYVNKKNCHRDSCVYKDELNYYANKHLEDSEKLKLIFNLIRKAGLTSDSCEYLAELVNETGLVLPLSEFSIVIYENSMNNLVFSYGSSEASHFLNNVIFKNYRYYDAVDELKNILKYNFLIVPIIKEENDFGYIFFHYKKDSYYEPNMLIIQIMCEYFGYIAKQIHMERAFRKELEEGSRSFAEFSHELKTPLNAIVGYSDLLKEEMKDANPKLLEYVENINSGSKQLKSLMMDIIESAKLRYGRLKISTEEFSTKAAILNVLEVFSSKIKEKQLIPEIILMDVTILSDLTKFNQVLYNAISNCVKFSQTGGKIRLITWVDNENFHFEINNEGCGVSPEELEKIFKFLSQANTGNNENKEGSGIGLSICKKVVEMQGGKVSLASTPEDGTTFSFYLPMN